MSLDGRIMQTSSTWKTLSNCSASINSTCRARRSHPVTHVNYSALTRTVHADTNPRYHAMISAVTRQIDRPVIVITSTTVRGEPIVCTPEDASWCFISTKVDTLAIGSCWLNKDQQLSGLKERYERIFGLD